MLIAAGPAMACPTCRDSVATRDDAEALVAEQQAAGFNGAIWTMLATAVVAAGGLSFTLIRKPRMPDR